MKLIHLGTQYGGWTIDIDLVPESGYVLDCGVGTDISFAEALHELRPGLRFVMVDHTDEAKEYVERNRKYNWTEFVHAAVAPAGVKSLTMYRHKTSGSESFSLGHNFINPRNDYQVPTVALLDLVNKFNPCIVKLDIESAEYATIREVVGVPQVCCEFHHRMDTKYTAKDTQDVITDFERAGYKVEHRTPTDEILMVKR